MSTYQFLTTPSTATGLTPASGSTAWTFGSWVEVINSTGTDILLTGLTFQMQTSPAVADTTYEQLFEIGTGASSSEVTKVQIPYSYRADSITSANNGLGYWHIRPVTFYLSEPFYVTAGTRVAVRVTDDIASAITYGGVKLLYKEASSDRYWVGGTGNWDSTNILNWAYTSGGQPGASVPTSANPVFLDANSGTVTVTLTTTGSCLGLDCTGFTGTLATANYGINVYGSLKLVAGMTHTFTSGGFGLLGTGTHTVDTGGQTLWSTAFNGAGSNYTLNSDLTTTSQLSITAGTFNANTKNVTCGYFTSSSGTRTINMSSGLWTVGSAGSNMWNVTSTGMTLNKDTANIKFNGTSTVNTNFNGGGLSYNDVWFNETKNGFYTIISGDNSFADLKIDDNYQVKFTSGSTQTVTSFTANGTLALGIALTITSYQEITSVTIINGGTGYVTSPAARNKLNLTGGNNDGQLTITSVSGGVVTGVSITTPGSGYIAGTTYATTNGTGSGVNCTIRVDTINTTNWIIADSSGTNNVTGCYISYSTAIGGATWNAFTSNDNFDEGGNTGWNFTAPTLSGARLLTLLGVGN